LAKREQETLEKLQEMNVDDEIIDLGALALKDILVLAKGGITTLNDLADLSAGELMDLLPNLDENSANEVIMKSRKHWFE
jgi:transcription termination factor NusA